MRRIILTRITTTTLTAELELAPPRASAGTHLSAAAHHVLVTGELLHAHRSTRVEAVGGDADLGAHAEFAAIRKLRRGVVQHDGTVHFAQKTFCRRGIRGDDGIGMRRTI